MLMSQLNLLLLHVELQAQAESIILIFN